MTKEIRKKIMKISKSKYLYFKWPSGENFLAYKNEKSKCNNITKYAKKKVFSKGNSKKLINHSGM